MTHKISTYILAGLLGIILITPQYHGYKALGDVFATWKNDGYSTEEARCAVLLTGSVTAKEIK